MTWDHIKTSTQLIDDSKNPPVFLIPISCIWIYGIIL